MVKIILLVIISIIITSCSSNIETGREFNHLDNNKIKLNDSRIKVMRIFGEPHKEKYHEYDDKLVLEYKYIFSMEKYYRCLCFEFHDDKVYTKTYHSTFEKDIAPALKNFDKINANTMSLNDITKLLGEPTGFGYADSFAYESYDFKAETTKVYTWNNANYNRTKHGLYRPYLLVIGTDEAGLVTDVFKTR